MKLLTKWKVQSGNLSKDIGLVLEVVLLKSFVSWSVVHFINKFYPRVHSICLQ